jgi:hypothetical protein
MLRSATLIIGILLAIAAFFGFLFLGGMFAPPPYYVMVAVQDIPANTVIDESMVGMDTERLTWSVVKTLVQRQEWDSYSGGFSVDNIRAGEPIRKGSIVAPGNAAGASRYALLITDPSKVAMVIPVDAKSAPGAVSAGDRIDLVVSFGASNLTNSNPAFSEQLAAATPLPNGFSLGPTPRAPVLSTPNSVPTQSVSNGFVQSDQMNLPSSKIVVEAVPVLVVHYGESSNPSYSGGAGSLAGGGSAGTGSEAYVRGPIDSLTVAVPREAAEFLAFGLDNGKIHVTILSPKVGANGEAVQTSTLGVSWNDLMAWMMHERQQATSNAPVLPAATAISPQNPAAQPAQPTVNPGAAAAPVVAPASDLSTRPSSQPSSSGLDLSPIIMLVSCGGVFLVMGVIAVRFIRRGRKQRDLV